LLLSGIWVSFGAAAAQLPRGPGWRDFAIIEHYEFILNRCRSWPQGLTAGYQGTNIIWVYSEPLPLNCRGGCYFWLDPKVTKRSSHQIGFFAAKGLCRTKPEKLRAVPTLVGTGPPYRFNTLHAKICYALTHFTKPEVFPAFSRSLSADGGKEI